MGNFFAVSINLCIFAQKYVKYGKRRKWKRLETQAVV